MPFSKTQHRLSSRDRLSSIHKRNILILKVLLGVVIFIAFTSFVISTICTGSVSMEPVLEKGSCSLFHPIRRVKEMERGEVVLIEAPFYEQEHFLVNILNRAVGFFTFQKLQVSFYPREGWVNRYMIKRVVAVPGDTVKMENWILHIKKKDEPYFLTEFECSDREYDVRIDNNVGFTGENGPLNGNLPELTLNDGEYFVLGDNRRYSNDSYYWGILPEENIKGKLLFVYWPLSQFGVIH